MQQLLHNLDSWLLLGEQVGSLATKAVAQLCQFLDWEALPTKTHVLVTSQQDYCNTFNVGLPLKIIQKLQCGMQGRRQFWRFHD